MRVVGRGSSSRKGNVKEDTGPAGIGPTFTYCERLRIHKSEVSSAAFARLIFSGSMILEWGTTVMACNYEILSAAAITNIMISSSVLAEILFQTLHLVAAICFGFAVRRYHRYARSCVLSTWHVTCFCSASAGFSFKDYRRVW